MILFNGVSRWGFIEELDKRPGHWVQWLSGGHNTQMGRLNEFAMRRYDRRRSYKKRRDGMQWIYPHNPHLYLFFFTDISTATSVGRLGRWYADRGTRGEFWEPSAFFELPPALFYLRVFSAFIRISVDKLLDVAGKSIHSHWTTGWNCCCYYYCHYD